VNTGRVDEDDLDIRSVEHPPNLVAGGLSDG